jgi:hypothetical protein
MNLSKIFIWAAGAVILLGVLFRVVGITNNDFIFYDEGYYLNWNRPLGEVLVHHQLTGEEIPKAIFAYVNRCLASGKTLWFMLVDSRIFWGGLEQWSLSRVWASVLGLTTLALTFIFAKQFFNSKNIALGATALLAVLPSHVFYSRIGMQESLSALLVLSGFYFYLYSQAGIRPFGWRTFLAGFFWGLAYFSNYRLIMLPVLITFCELYLAFSESRRPDFRKWLWAILVFLLCVFGFGSFNDGQNMAVIFSWVFHQAEMANGQRSWINIFSYPYYLFRLDTGLFALAFFANVYFVAVKNWKPLLPFSLVLVQMAVFTCASEKGARYVGVVLPFMAMSVAYLISWLWTRVSLKKIQLAVIGFVVVMLLMMTAKSFALVRSSTNSSDYQAAVMFLKKHDPKAKILSSQPYVQKLYFNNSEDVREVPSSFEVLLNDYRNGYRYLILCPQAYISLTESKERFDPYLRGYLEVLLTKFPPKRVYRHFNAAILERFVLEHNENLARSIKFLNTAQAEHRGLLRIYDLGEIIPPMVNAAARSAVQSQNKAP